MKLFYTPKKLVLLTVFTLASIATNAQLALDFNGPGNYSQTTYTLNNTAFTVEFDMFMYNLPANGNGGINWTCAHLPSPVDFYVNSSGNTVLFGGNCGGVTSAATSMNLSVGAWHNIAYTYSSTPTPTLRLYIDGVLLSSNTTNITFQPTFRIGDRMDGGTNANAKYDNVRIWNVARTGPQVMADITACFTGSETNLDILYLMEEGSGTTINDLATGNGTQNGIISGPVAWSSGAIFGGASSIPVASCGPFASPSGNTYTASGIYTDTLPTAGGCMDSIVTIELVVNPYATNQTVNASTNTICDSGSVDINVGSSQPGFMYYLRDSSNTIISGPTAGNGSPLTFNTGIISSTNTYNILAQTNPNKSLSFDGVDDRVVANTTGSLTGNFTVEAWVRPNTTTGDLSIVGSRAPSECSFDFKLSGGNLIHADIGNGFGWFTTSANANFTYSAGQWYHIAYVVTPSSYTIYANGNNVGSGVISGTPILFDATHRLTIGDFSISGGESFNGLIDEVRVWNVGRTQSQIQTHKNIQLSGTEPNLVMYYNMNEISGATFANDTTSNYDGTLTNMNTLTAWQTNTPFTTTYCDYQLSQTQTITVNHSSTSTQNVTACNSFSWNSNLYTVSGTYMDTIPNIAGCDSIMTLNLTINNSTTSSQTVTACNSYNWNSNLYTSSGTYMDTISNSTGCDSVMTLNLTINNSTTSIQNITACDSYNWNSNLYTVSGTYIDTITNTTGCDSVMTLNLTINHSNTSLQNITACNSYNWNSNLYTTSGTYMDTIPNSTGCDSVITLNLTINHSSLSLQNIAACNSYSWNSNLYTSTGVYFDTIPNSSGCDSVMILNLTINHPSNSTQSITACDSYSWNSNLYTLSGIYMDTIPNSTGCDSVMTLNLTINHPSTSSQNITACNSYNWNSNVYNISGTYIDTIPNITGCDSVMTLNLTINNTNVGVTNTSPILTANATGAIYQWIDCDNGFTPISGETNQVFTAGNNGSYAVIVIQNSCTDTSACVNVFNIGIENNGFGNNFSAYPNPTEGNVTIELGETYQDLNISIMNQLGMVIEKRNMGTTHVLNLFIEGNPGVYFIEITTGTGQRKVIQLIKY